MLPANEMLITPRQQSCSEIFYAEKFDILLHRYGFTFCADGWMDGWSGCGISFVKKHFRISVLYTSGWSGQPVEDAVFYIYLDGVAYSFPWNVVEFLFCNVCVWMKWLRWPVEDDAIALGADARNDKCNQLKVYWATNNWRSQIMT